VNPVTTKAKGRSQTALLVAIAITGTCLAVSQDKSMQKQLLELFA
jgi:hypothetical protein